MTVYVCKTRSIQLSANTLEVFIVVKKEAVFLGYLSALQNARYFSLVAAENVLQLQRLVFLIFKVINFFTVPYIDS